VPHVEWNFEDDEEAEIALHGGVISIPEEVDVSVGPQFVPFYIPPQVIKQHAIGDGHPWQAHQNGVEDPAECLQSFGEITALCFPQPSNNIIIILDIINEFLFQMVDIII